MAKTQSADLVVVGAGMVGGWASWFAATSGAERVVVLEKDLAGQGASSRAAGVVRAQGGTPATVALGRFSIEFYRSQHARLGTDSGFRELGYLILAVTQRDVRDGNARVEMQRAAGLDVRWVDAQEACALNPTLATDGHRGGSFCATDGAIDPPRNVRAYSLAMQQAGVQLRERTPFLGLRTAAARGGRRRVTGVQTPDGVIATERVLLTGGPSLRAVGQAGRARGSSPAAARHQVVVTEPHPAFDVERQPMVFDVGAGIYWRLEEGGLLWGMSNPKETPGPAPRGRLAVPAADGTPPAQARAGHAGPRHPQGVVRNDRLHAGPPADPRSGASPPRASRSTERRWPHPAGHGMMWGPAVARVAADLALEGRTDVIDVTDMGMDRFDEHGRSPFYDPIALPFPPSAEDD